MHVLFIKFSINTPSSLFLKQPTDLLLIETMWNYYTKCSLPVSVLSPSAQFSGCRKRKRKGWRAPKYRRHVMSSDIAEMSSSYHFRWSPATTITAGLVNHSISSLFFSLCYTSVFVRDVLGKWTSSTLVHVSFPRFFTLWPISSFTVTAGGAYDSLF